MSTQKEGFVNVGTFKWTTIDTILAILVISFVFSLRKSTSYFFAEYAEGLGFSHEQYSYFLASVNVGQFTSIAITPFNDYYFSNSLQIVMFFGLLLSAFAMLIPIGAVINDTWYSLIWCCIMFWLFGNCSAIFTSSLMHIASEYADNPKRVLSYMLSFWAIATVYFLPISYMISDVNAYLPFFVLGICIFVSIICAYFCTWSKKYGYIQIAIDGSSDHDSHSLLIDDDDISIEDNEIRDDTNGFTFTILKEILQSKECLLIFLCTLVVETSRGVWSTVLSSLWMEEVYGWSTTDIGWLAALLCIVEFISVLFSSLIAYKINIFVLNIGLISWQTCVTLTIFVLSVVIGDSIGGIWAAILVIIDFYFVLNYQFFVLLLAVVKYQPSGNSKRTAMSIFVSLVALGKCIGILISTHLWMDSSGLCWVALYSFSCYLICMLCWVMIYCYDTFNGYERVLNAN